MMIASEGSDEVLAAIRTRISFVDTIPFIVELEEGWSWRSLLLFNKGTTPGQQSRPPLSETAPIDSLCFHEIIECLSVPGDTVLDPYGHCEIAGSALYLGRRYLGFQPTADRVRWLADKLEWDLDTFADFAA